MTDGYDPYFVQTEFEAIQSEPVLGKVIEKLNLSEAWAKKRGASEKLKTEETLSLLKKKLDLQPVKNSSLIDIGVKSAMYTRVFIVALTLVAALGTAAVYWLGGRLVLEGTISLGTLGALALYVQRIYTKVADVGADPSLGEPTPGISG